MKHLILCIALLGSVGIFAQNVRIDGTVIADSSAISLGQVTIFSLPDSTLIKGTYLDSSYFDAIIRAKNGNDFYAKIKVPGYSDTLVPFTVADTIVHLGVLQLEGNKSLDAVDVVYRKPLFERTMDGISINVEGTTLQNLTNLFEVLTASPKITSPDNEKIEIIGRGTPLILVDRQAIISNDELKAIPAAQIERIEIITNPSAKYKAQGSGNGVIEVYTKNFHLQGYNVSINAAAGISTQLKPTSRLGVGISLKKKKISLNGYFGGNYNEQNGFGSSNGFATDDSDREIISEYSNDSRGTWQYYNIKSAYNINEKQRLTLGVNGNGNGGQTETTAFGEYYTNGMLITRDASNSETYYQWANNNAFINYTHETDTNNSALEINLNYTNRRSNNGGEYFNTYEFVPTSDFSDFEVKNDSRNVPNIGELRVNYEHNFDTTGWTLEFGGAYSLLINNQTFDRSNRTDAGEWVVDPNFSNSYDYQEDIGGAFVEVSKNWDKFGFRVGARGEYTKLDGFSNSLDKQFIDSSYFLLFPTASVLFQPLRKLGITAFYKSGIDRPQFSNYDPFVRVEDSLNISYGNPFLRPATEHTFGLDFDIMYAYNLSFTYKSIKDPTSNITFVNENSFVTETTPFNADSEQSLGASLTLPFQKKWVQGWNSLWINYSKYNFSPIFGRQPFFNLTYGVYSYLTFNLKAGLSIQNRLHINKWGGSENESNAMVSWGLRLTKKFNGNKLQLFADVSDIIPPKNRQTRFAGNFQYQTNNQWQFTTFKLGVFVKFGRLKAADQIQESSSKQTDRL